MLQSGGVYPGHPAARGAAAARRLLRRPRRPRRSCSSGWGSPTSGGAPGASCPAASSSACRSRSPWSGKPRGGVPRRADRRRRRPGPPADPQHGHRRAGRTTACACMLTTHDLDEAEKVADRVVIIDRGRLVADGTPDRADGRGRQPARSASARPPASTPPRSARRCSAAVDEAVAGRVPGRRRADAGQRRHAHRLAGRAGPAAGRPPGRAPAPGGRVPAHDRDHRGGAGGASRPAAARAALAAATATTGAAAVQAPHDRRHGASRAASRAGRPRPASSCCSRCAGASRCCSRSLIPVLLLAFFATVDVLPTGDGRPDRLPAPRRPRPGGHVDGAWSSWPSPPGSSARWACSSASARRPLTRRQLLGAKTAAVVVIEVLQLIVLVVEGLLLGFRLLRRRAGRSPSSLPCSPPSRSPASAC